MPNITVNKTIIGISKETRKIVNAIKRKRTQTEAIDEIVQMLFQARDLLGYALYSNYIPFEKKNEFESVYYRIEQMLNPLPRDIKDITFSLMIQKPEHLKAVNYPLIQLKGGDNKK